MVRVAPTEELAERELRELRSMLEEAFDSDFSERDWEHADDGDIMILRTPTTPALDLDAQIVCDWRAGDVW